MALTNSHDRYGWLTIVLHWAVAAGVVGMFATGLMADAAGDAGDRQARGALMGLHISMGMALFAVFALRILAHYVQRRPEKTAQPGWLNLISSAVQHILLLGLLIQILSGPLAVWSGGRAINVFDVIALTSPFAERHDLAHEAAEIAHFVGRWMIFVALVAHVLGALKHLVLDRDGAFTRMLWPSRLKASR